jgi:hypothetical protein
MFKACLKLHANPNRPTCRTLRPFAGDGQGRRSRSARALMVPREADPCEHRIDGNARGEGRDGRPGADAATGGDAVKPPSDWFDFGRSCSRSRYRRLILRTCPQVDPAHVGPGRAETGEASLRHRPRGEVKRRERVSTPPRSCLRQRGCRPWSGRSRAGAAGPASRATSSAGEGLRAPAAAVLDASEPNDQVGGALSRGSLPTGLHGAAGSRGIERIHVVERSASGLLCAMSP